jgi:tetratricopeptide (TPR) repeat protein
VELYQRLGDHPDASRVAGKLSLLSITNGDFAGGIEWARRSGSDSDLSYALLQSGDLPGALAAGLRHLATLDKLPATPENRRKTASFLVLLGQIQGRNGLMPAGVESFRRAREIHRKLLEAAPNDLTLKSALALDYQVLARVMMRRGDPTAAIGLLRQTLDLQSDVLNADPRNERSQNSLRITISLLSNELARVGQSEEALSLGRRSLAIADAMNRHSPTARAQADIADSHLAIGEALDAGHQSAAAIAEYKIALDILTAMDAQSTLSIDDRAELNTVKRKLQPAAHP